MAHNGKAKTRRYHRRIARRAAQADTDARLDQAVSEHVDDMAERARLDAEAAAFDTGYIDDECCGQIISS